MTTTSKTAPLITVKLAFYVTATHCYGAVQTASVILRDSCALNNSSQSSLLVPFIQNLLQSAGNPVVTSMHVPCGPGSFTALRVMLATAQGLSIAWENAHIHAPTFFDLLLFDAPTDSLAVIDSKRGDLFVQHKDANAKVHPPEILTRNAFDHWCLQNPQTRLIVDPDLAVDGAIFKAHSPDADHLLNALLQSDHYATQQTFDPYYLFTPEFKKANAAIPLSSGM